MEIINAGLSATTRSGHLAMLRHIEDLSPDAVAFLLGINGWYGDIISRMIPAPTPLQALRNAATLRIAKIHGMARLDVVR